MKGPDKWAIFLPYPCEGKDSMMLVPMPSKEVADQLEAFLKKEGWPDKNGWRAKS